MGFRIFIFRLLIVWYQLVHGSVIPCVYMFGLNVLRVTFKDNLFLHKNSVTI